MFNSSCSIGVYRFTVSWKYFSLGWEWIFIKSWVCKYIFVTFDQNMFEMCHKNYNFIPDCTDRRMVWSIQNAGHIRLVLKIKLMTLRLNSTNLRLISFLKIATIVLPIKEWVKETSHKSLKRIMYNK